MSFQVLCNLLGWIELPPVAICVPTCPFHAQIFFIFVKWWLSVVCVQNDKIEAKSWYMFLG